eukprot:CAMPEP_0172485916 /NCGR_PEP_ID=MMETSP1066-20121228/14195_1 /TAXON_ID=671091 /ORGANISM="Coscinodiscus wailesii, Strain CCMP2513" /LENGTH=395 /DNA_ID=CAMNT_0013251495 /DNA_START=220 /DNA_END=1407 /DNA_ORIENTATION=+
MYQRDSKKLTTCGLGNTRRAFKDVTNASTRKNVEDAPLPIKRSNKVLPSRSHLVIGAGNSSRRNPRKCKNDHSTIGTNVNAHISLGTRNTSRNDTSAQAVFPLQNNTSLFSRQNNFQSISNSYQYTAPADNIDERDAEDPLCATDYVQDMYDHFREKEASTVVVPRYMENQPHINERMRSILVNWLVEVHLKFKLVPETLYLTIKLIDRYLEKREVTRPKLQLVGVTCLLLASKYEEIYPPALRDLVYICDSAYSKKEILDMEEHVIKTLEYRVTFPSAHLFLVRFLKAAHADKKMVQLACYILDGTLKSYSLLKYQPSQLAAAAILIARNSVGRNRWSPTLLKYAKYCEEDVIPVARAVLSEKANAACEFHAVDKKYASSRYGSVADTVFDCDF